MGLIPLHKIPAHAKSKSATQPATLVLRETNRTMCTGTQERIDAD
jgi:hypothetical protein